MAIVIGIVGMPIVVFAQDLPPSDNAGAQAERFKAAADRERERVEKRELKPPAIGIKEMEVKAPPSGPSFILNEVRITGATIFTDQEFRLIYGPYIHKTVTFVDLEEIVSKIKAGYKSKRYLTSTAFLPEQDIRDGRVEIKVIEGKMGRLTVEGNKWVSTDLIERYFHIKKNELLNIKKLERDILRMNQNTDVEVKTVISAGKEAETSDITLQVLDKCPWHLGIGEDGLGTRLVGKYRTSVYGRSTSVTGNWDSLYVSSLFTAGSFGEFASYTVPLDSYGTKVGLDFVHFDMKIGRELRDEDFTGNTEIYIPHISWEMYLSSDFQADIEAGMDIKSIKRKTGASLSSSEQLRLPYIGYNFVKIDSFGGQTTFAPKFVFGTEAFLGARPESESKPSRATSGIPFVKYEQTLRRLQRMPWESYMVLNSQFQAPSHTLPSSEQIQLGGLYSVRGYPEGDYSADIGAAMNIDWVFPMYLIPKDYKLLNSKTPLRQQIEPVVFFDMGCGQLRNVTQGERYTKLLIGAGGGVRVRLYDKVYVRLEWAQPIGDAPTPGAGLSTFHLVFQADI